MINIRILLFFKECKDIERVYFNKINISQNFSCPTSRKTGIVLPWNAYPIALDEILAGFAQFQLHE